MSQIFGWLGDVWFLIPGNNELIKAAVLGIVGALLGAIAVWLGRRLLRWYTRSKGGWFDYRWRVERARSAVSPTGPGLWLAIDRKLPSTYDLRMSGHPRVLVVANQKGGVGKTTLTINLASAFARRLPQDRPILAIDLDPQGSMGPLMFAGSDWRPMGNDLSAVSQLVLKTESAANLARLIRPFTHFDSRGQTVRTPNAMGLSAFYDLAASEDRGLVEWLIGDRLRDVRYDLFEFLSSPPIKDRFGLVIIDAPPRTTLASIQALCASTHVLIPTKLDDPSANAVGYFATHLNTHRHIWPKLRVAGIIGCMTRVSPAIEPRYLTTSGDALRNILSGADLRHVESLGYDFEIPYEMGIRNLSPIVRAAERGAAVDVLTDSDGGADVRTMFDNLAQELEARMR